MAKPEKDNLTADESIAVERTTLPKTREITAEDLDKLARYDALMQQQERERLETGAPITGGPPKKIETDRFGNKVETF